MANTSIKDVAKLAGVSIATVSRTLNFPGRVSENTRRRVESAIQETGYQPNPVAQSFRRGRTNILTVVTPSIGDPFAARVMSGIQAAAAEKSYSVYVEEKPLWAMSRDEFSALLNSRQSDGMIIIASIPSEGIEVLTAGNRPTVPVVIASEAPAEITSMPCVHIDNFAAASDATEHLISYGHEHIAMIYGYEESPRSIARLRGFQTAMDEAGLTVPEEWIVEGFRTVAGGRDAAMTLLEPDTRPTAIFCGNDNMALGCLHEARVLGLRVPDELSVMGFDDIQFAEVSNPPLTTIAQPAEDIGERILALLCQVIDGEPTPDPAAEIVPHQLVIRDSVSAPASRSVADPQ